MNLSALDEITSDDKLLNCLALAIAEAKTTRSLLRAEPTSVFTARQNGHLEKLTSLGKEIDYLEAKLIAVKSRINREPCPQRANPEYA